MCACGGGGVSDPVKVLERAIKFAELTALEARVAALEEEIKGVEHRRLLVEMHGGAGLVRVNGLIERIAALEDAVYASEYKTPPAQECLCGPTEQHADCPEHGANPPAPRDCADPTTHLDHRWPEHACRNPPAQPQRCENCGGVLDNVCHFSKPAQERCAHWVVVNGICADCLTPAPSPPATEEDWSAAKRDFEREQYEQAARDEPLAPRSAAPKEHPATDLNDWGEPEPKIIPKGGHHPVRSNKNAPPPAAQKEARWWAISPYIDGRIGAAVVNGEAFRESDHVVRVIELTPEVEAALTNAAFHLNFVENAKKDRAAVERVEKLIEGYPDYGHGFGSVNAKLIREALHPERGAK